MACFRAKRDRVWIKDTARYAARPTPAATPGFRCYGTYQGGRQICDFDRQLAEKRIFLWYVSTWQGSKIKWTGDAKLLRTS
ncbi:hypothetical protein ACWD6P_36260 [Streptomyces sp. NPDC002446]